MALKTATNNIPNQVAGQITNSNNQHMQQTTNQLNTLQNNITNQIQGSNAKIDTINSSMSSMKVSLDNANKQITTLQNQETATQATINNLQTVINNLQTRLQQPYPYPYPPYNYPYPYPPYYPYNPLVATAQNNSGLLTLATNQWTDQLRWYTTYTLTGYITLLLTNPTASDIDNTIISIGFQLSGVPNIQSCTPQLKGGNISWTNTIANSNELKFQPAEWGVQVKANQSLTLPLVLTASTLANYGWTQSYPFSVSVSTN
jgi:hypothetical protein